MRREIGARREGPIYQCRPVDAEGDRLANRLVVERCEPVVEADVDGVEALAVGERQFRVRLDGFDVGGRDEVDAIDRGLAQFGEPPSGIRVGHEDHRADRRLWSPVAIEPGQRDVAGAVPAVHAERACSVHLGQDPLAARGPLDPALEPRRVVNGQRGRGDLGEERRIGVAQLEDDGGGVLGADPPDRPLVRTVLGVLAGGLLAWGRARFRIGHRHEGAPARGSGRHERALGGHLGSTTR
jgi:hypothetical protein